jgi:hypothetical protein
VSPGVIRSGGWNREMCLALHYDETHWHTQIWINQYNVLYNNVPFGGKKQSGIGTRDQPFQESAASPDCRVFY